VRRADSQVRNSYFFQDKHHLRPERQILLVSHLIHTFEACTQRRNASSDLISQAFDFSLPASKSVRYPGGDLMTKDEAIRLDCVIHFKAQVDDRHNTNIKDLQREGSPQPELARNSKSDADEMNVGK
jgi:hypothetical protein